MVKPPATLSVAIGIEWWALEKATVSHPPFDSRMGH